MSNVTVSCRDATELNILVRIMLELALADIRKQGVNPLVTETYRPLDRQHYLYCQGRTIAECTTKGIGSVFAKAYSNPKAGKVTWTLDSIHIQRKAVDVIPQRLVKGKMTAIYNTKDPQTQIIIKTMQKYGFEPGANWTTTPDSPHFQVKGDFSAVFDSKHTTTYVTKAIQSALGIKADGLWGNGTIAAVNAFRSSRKYSDVTSGSLGSTALKALLGKLA
ncbi:MAG: cwlK 1 [Herbinix sp.]|jgi:peptidoglycan L-alanyl-D-glutamate endopeptidase CwlK|nr:cwlK 1 [Herbinix sp.]